MKAPLKVVVFINLILFLGFFILLFFIFSKDPSKTILNFFTEHKLVDIESLGFRRQSAEEPIKNNGTYLYDLKGDLHLVSENDLYLDAGKNVIVAKDLLVKGSLTADTLNGNFIGTLAGNVEGNISGDATGLSGNPSVVLTDLLVYGNLTLPNNSIKDSNVTDDITALRYLPIAGGVMKGNLELNGHNIVGGGVIESEAFRGYFYGDLTGDVVGNISGEAGGLSGKPSAILTDLTVEGTILFPDDALTDEMIPDVVTASNYLALSGGVMSGDIDLNQNSLTNVNDIQVTTLSGVLTGSLIGNVTGSATGLSGNPDLVVNILTTPNLTLTTGAVNGYIMTSNDSGEAYWQSMPPAINYWTLTGNNLYPNFTTQNLALGGTDAGTAKLYVNGSVGVGTTTPGSHMLNVNGSLIATDYYSGDGTQGATLSVSGLEFKDGLYTSGSITGLMPSGTEGQMLYNNAGTWSAFSGMYWDDTGSRLGIGTTSPTALLHQYSVSTSTTFAGYTLDWQPGSSTTTTNDLFRINIGSNGTAANLLNILDNGSSLFSVSETAVTSNIPTNFTSAGDVSMSYDLIFTNETAASIITHAPFTIDVGESFSSNNLTLKTYNSGSLVMDLAGGASLSQAQNWGLATSTTALNIQSGLLNLDTTNNRVGIGTTNPTQKLDVVGSIKGNNRLYLPTTTGTNSEGVFLNSSNGNMAAFQSLDLGGKTYTFFANNKYYTGSGWADMGSSRTGGSLQITDDSLSFYSVNSGTTITSRLTVASGGNVGIGITSPVSKFQVYGGDTVLSDTLTYGLPTKLQVNQIHGVQAGLEQFTTFIGTSYPTADTGIKQGLRLQTCATHTTGTLDDLRGLVAVTYADGGGTVTESSGVWSHLDALTNSTIITGYNFKSANDYITTGGSVTNQYGLYIEDMTSGATTDYGIAIAGADTQALWIGSGADNTDAANGIAFGASSDTNLYRGAANQLKTDDSVVVSGSVGIGTTSLGSLLTIAGNVELNVDDPLIVLVDSGASGTIWKMKNGVAGNGKLSFTDGDTARVTFVNDGKVGIGTTSPGALLDIGLATSVLGTMRLAGNTSGYVQIQPSAAAGSWTMTLPANDGDSGQVLQTDGSGVTSWATAAGGGANTALSNLVSTAINTSLVSDAADTDDLGSTTYEWNSLFLADGSGLTAGGGAFFGNDQDFLLTYDEVTSDALKLSDGTNTFLSVKDQGTVADFAFNVDDVFIKNDGMVGIGTTNPTQKLTVNEGSLLINSGGTPTLLGSIDYANSSIHRAIQVVGKYAYTAKEWAANELSIYDVSNPNSPTTVSGIDFGTDIHGYAVDVAGKYAYLGNATAAGTCSGTTLTGCEFRIYNVSNPYIPSAVAGLDLGADVRTVYVSGKYAYIGTSSVAGNDFHVIDISNPSSPVDVGGVDIGREVSSIFVSGKYAYLGNAWASGGTCSGATIDGCEFRIYDISNPVLPVAVGGQELSNGYSVYISGKYAYAGQFVDGVGTCSGTTVDDCGLVIFDISNPSSPTIVGGGLSGKSASYFGIKVAGKYAYVGSGSVTGNDFNIVDISTPTAPVPVVGGVDVGNSVYAVALSGKYVYLGTANSATLQEFQIYDIAGIDAPAATIGTIAANSLSVSENAIINNNLYVNNGINVGIGGIYSQGLASVGINSTSDTALSVTQAGAGDILNLNNSSGEVVTALSSGNIGIGTTSPTGRLSVTESGAKTTADYGLYLNNIATSSTTSVNKYGAYISSTGTWNGSSGVNYGLFVDAPTGGASNYAAIFAGGYVGIGTTAPTNPLQVVDTAGIRSGTASKYIDIYTSGGGNDINSSHTLHLNYGNSQPVSIGEGGTSNLYVSGSVGIGTTNPGAKLEVNGGIRLNTVTAKPTCDATARGTTWFTQGAAGVKDAYEVCAKDVGDAYSWRTIY